MKLTEREHAALIIFGFLAQLSKSAEENWAQSQVDMLTRLAASVLNCKTYDQVTEEEIEKLKSEIRGFQGYVENNL